MPRGPKRLADRVRPSIGLIGLLLIAMGAGCNDSSSPAPSSDTVDVGRTTEDTPTDSPLPIDVARADTVPITRPALPVLEGCLGDEDQAYLNKWIVEVADWSYGCALSCTTNSDPLCTYACIINTTELSAECAFCYAISTSCAVKHCAAWCGGRPIQAETCTECIKGKCLPEFESCSGRK